MFTFADICAGIGGFRLALEQHGLRCVFTSEINQSCIETYNKNFNTNENTSDITKIDPCNIPSFDILCAGFPCQPFSIAGKRMGLDDERTSVLHQILKIVAIKKPKVIFLENVENFKNMSDGSIFEKTIAHLNSIGYIVHHDVLDASYFGVPQKRKRLFIIAFRKDVSSGFFSFPIGNTTQETFRNHINPGDNSIPVTSRWGNYIDYYTGKKSLKDLPFTPPRTRLALERIGKNTDLDNCVLQMRSSGIRAVSIDEPLPTLAVSISGGGAMIPVYTKERRHLNLIELKRIMGFPDEYIFPVSRTDAIKQLANAVVPAVIKAISENLIQDLKISHGAELDH